VRDVLEELGQDVTPMERFETDGTKTVENVVIRLTNFESQARILVNKGFGSNETCVFEFISDEDK
jgi:hypothetical protein